MEGCVDRRHWDDNGMLAMNVCLGCRIEIRLSFRRGISI